MSQQAEYDPSTSVKNMQDQRSPADLNTWAERLKKFLAAQAGVRGNIVISDMRVPQQLSIDHIERNQVSVACAAVHLAVIDHHTSTGLNALWSLG